jgi:hypothetical protein
MICIPFHPFYLPSMSIPGAVEKEGIEIWAITLGDREDVYLSFSSAVPSSSSSSSSWPSSSSSASSSLVLVLDNIEPLPLFPLLRANGLGLA